MYFGDMFMHLGSFPVQSLEGLRWLETLFQKCEKNGFKHNTVDY